MIASGQPPLQLIKPNRRSAVRFFSLPHALRAYCDRCSKDKSKFRCTGCQAVLYCSKECQKAAWRTHKPVCTTEPNSNFELQANDLGYPSPLVLSNALDEWIEIQRWCLYTLTCALVQLEGGVDAVLASQKGLVLHVVPAHRSEHDGNPAMAFRFGHAVIADKDSDGFLRENWKDVSATVQHARVSSTLAFLAAGQRNERLATPLGSFPVVYFGYRTNLASCHTFTLFQLPLRHVAGNSKDAAAHARTRAACEELVHIIQELLCGGVVYRRAENPRRGPEPDWGIYERTGRRMKRWKWRQLPTPRESWRMWERATDETLRDRTSGLTGRQLLTLFDYGRLGTKW